jgi:hypothetical protein
MPEFNVPADVETQVESIVAAAAPKSFQEYMVTLDIVTSILEMPQGTSSSGSPRMMLCLGKPQPQNHIVSHLPDIATDLFTFKQVKFIKPVRFYISIWPA